MGIIWLFSQSSCVRLPPGNYITQTGLSQMVFPFTSLALCFKWGQLLATMGEWYSVSSLFILLRDKPKGACLVISFYYYVRWNHSSAYCPSIIKYLSRLSQVLQTITLLYGYLKFLWACCQITKTVWYICLKGDHRTERISWGLVWNGIYIITFVVSSYQNNSYIVNVN